MSRAAVVAPAALAVLVAGCGGGTTAPATGASPTATPGGSRNLVRGEVVSIDGQAVTVTTSDGTDAHFTLAPTATVNQRQDAAIADVGVGTCAFGIGQRIAADLVAAQEVVVSDHGPGGAGDCRRGGGGDIRRLEVAGGEVTAVDGDVYTVSSRAGPQRFRVALQTRAIRLVRVPVSSLATGQCVTARGARNAGGDITASSVVVSPRGVTGCFPAGASGPSGGG